MRRAASIGIALPASHGRVGHGSICACTGIALWGVLCNASGSWSAVCRYPEPLRKTIDEINEWVYNVRRPLVIL